MKIGIMTFWWSQDNYGQLLQCYALQKYLRDLGHDAYLIRYADEEKTPLLKKMLKAFNPILLYRFIKRRITSKKNMKMQASISRKFDEFREKYIKQSDVYYRSYRQLKENPPAADVYIVGSDQVWNFTTFYNNSESIYKSIHSYMLDFGEDNIKRMSYAASWSVKSISQELISEITPLIKKFSYVSVREESGISLCKQCGCENAELVCDPTFLLSADIYRKLYMKEKIRRREKKYIMLYMLNNECEFDIQRVYDYAKAKDLDVVYVTGNGVIDNREEFFATIPEWLYLIDNAEYVITNSFHCCVFSSLFSKKFGVIKLKGKVAGMNSRLETLFNLLKIESRYIDSCFSDLEKEYKINKVNIESNFLEKLNA